MVQGTYFFVISQEVNQSTLDKSLLIIYNTIDNGQRRVSA